jgi:hypothetical protein
LDIKRSREWKTIRRNCIVNYAEELATRAFITKRNTIGTAKNAGSLTPKELDKEIERVERERT